MRRITYTEAVGELDGLTATFSVPPNEVKKLMPLMEPGLPFEVELLDAKGKVLGKREGDIVAVNHERKGSEVAGHPGWTQLPTSIEGTALYPSVGRIT